MKFLLILSWLAMGGGGYFGYTIYQQTLADSQKATADLAAANASAADLSTKVTNLTRQLSDLQTQLAEQKVKADAPVVVATSSFAAAPPAPSAPPVTIASSLPDTITTIYGKTYTGCVLSRVMPDGISFTHSMGVAKVLFTDLDPAFAAKYGYDAATAKQYEQNEAQREAQSDAIRAAAAQSTAQSTASASAAVATATVAADASAQAAKQNQIAALQQQITGLQNQAQSLDAQDVARFNSIENIYYSSSGQIEHRSTLGHSPQAVEDRNQITVLQSQIASLQN